MKKRLISAILMVILFVPILLLGDIYYPLLGSVLGIIGLWELLNLEKNIPTYIKFISCFIGVFLILYNYSDKNYFTLYSFPIIAGLFILLSCSLVIKNDLSKYTFREMLWLFGSLLIIGLLFNSFIRIRLFGIYPVIYCFIVSIMTDTFAYLGGMRFGKHKLNKAISPNKTIEGSIIGSIMGTICASIFYYLVIGNLSLISIILLSLGLTLISQIGDLFFSSIKRYYKVKDFSNLIPGHGGVLDRLDSVLFVILAFLLYSII